MIKLMIVLFITSIVFSIYAAVGESAVITLVFPYGARSTAMGEVGTALADDESALFYNPAGLAIENRFWQNGAVSGFYEPLMPNFIPNIWHSSYSAYYQPKDLSSGGFGSFFNYLDMGTSTLNNSLGQTVKKTHSSESVTALGWGFNLSTDGISNNNFGITFKFINSRLAPGYGKHGEGTAQSFAVDLGYLYCAHCGLRIGFTLMNMGPNVFYISHDSQDPIPFTANFALGYKHSLSIAEDLNFSIACETRLDKELVVNHYSKKPDPFWEALYTGWTDEDFEESIKEINVHTGYEIGIMNTVYFRNGFLFDIVGQRYECTYGFGINIFNHLRFDYSYIHSPECYMDKLTNTSGSNGVRDGQWRTSLALTKLFSWSKEDCMWWKNP